MKVYIAGPMTGYPEHNYPAFNKAADDLRAIGFDVLNPVDVDARCTDECDHDWHWYMRRTLALLLTADRVVLLPGWVGSKGARIEKELADRLGIPITPLEYTDPVQP